jgi:hypothetical protein
MLSRKNYKTHQASLVFGFILLFIFLPPEIIAQVKQMIVCGNISIEGALPPNGTQVRILRADSVEVRTSVFNPDTIFYKSDTVHYAVNIFSSDGYADGDPILFRIVFPANDSIIARTAPETVSFSGVTLPSPSPVVVVNLWNNHRPTITSLPDTVAHEDSIYQYKISATDPDKDKLIFKFLKAPSWLHIDTSTGIISGIPRAANFGDTVVVVQVNDGYFRGINVQSYSIHIHHSNSAPYFVSSIPDTTIAEGQTLQYQYLAIGTDKDSLIFAEISGPEYSSITKTGLFSWTPAYHQAGKWIIVISISDGLTVDIDSAHITVANTNRPPTAVRLFFPSMRDTIQLLTQNLPLQFTWRSSFDPDEDTVLYNFVLRGADIDTTIVALRDTTILLPIMSRLDVARIYNWTVNITDRVFVVASPDTFIFYTSSTILDVENKQKVLPEEFTLHQNYPNPFNPSTTISYNLVKVLNLDNKVTITVSLRVYDVLGREIAVLVNEEKPAGEYRIDFNASHLPSGVYFYRLSTENFVAVRKMLLLK